MHPVCCILTLPRLSGFSCMYVPRQSLRLVWQSGGTIIAPVKYRKPEQDRFLFPQANNSAGQFPCLLLRQHLFNILPTFTVVFKMILNLGINIPVTMLYFIYSL